MKKIAMLLIMLMAIGAVQGFCLTTVDGFLDNRAKSDLAPVADSAKVLGEVNKGLGKTLDAIPVVKERGKAMEPVYKVKNETVSMSKKIINGTWDIITLKFLRDKSDKK